MGLLFFLLMVAVVAGIVFLKKSRDNDSRDVRDIRNAAPSVTPVTVKPPVVSKPSEALPKSAEEVSTPTAPVQDSFIKECLDTHNKFRAIHGVGPLEWDASLAEYAKDHGNKCVWGHSMGPHGENLALGYRTPNAAITDWYNEISLYDYNNPGFSHGVGHFTQVVWKSSTKVGCALVNCPGLNGTNGQYLVCEYNPPGNMNSASSFRANVLPPKNNMDQEI